MKWFASDDAIWHCGIGTAQDLSKDSRAALETEHHEETACGELHSAQYATEETPKAANVCEGCAAFAQLEAERIAEEKAEAEAKQIAEEKAAADAEAVEAARLEAIEAETDDSENVEDDSEDLPPESEPTGH